MTTAKNVRVGVLALQGDFREHKRAFGALCESVSEVRLPADLEGLTHLVVPGGESTTIGRLAREYGIEQSVREKVTSGALAVWGTCAGAIWISAEIEGRPNQERLGLLDATARRNAFGRQIDSFVTDISVEGLTGSVKAVFIRAPSFARVGAGVKVLARHEKEPILVRQGRLLASTFHPELTDDRRLQELFLTL